MAVNKILLKGLFESLQKQMLAQLSTNREFIIHPTSKGDALEDVWIQWLRKFLPNRYCVEKAIIIDSLGNLSNQIDVVIFDQQYTPFVFSQNGIHYIPAEGVYAVFEVKPDLKGTVGDLSYIEYAGNKIASVRSLIRTSTTIIDRGPQHPARPLTKIIGGILASVNTMKQKTLEGHLHKLGGLQTIDMGCAVENYAFYIDYTGEEEKGIQDLNQRIKTYYEKRLSGEVTYSNDQTALISFFYS